MLIICSIINLLYVAIDGQRKAAHLATSSGIKVYFLPLGPACHGLSLHCLTYSRLPGRGGMSKIQTILFKKEIEKTYCQYAFFIATWHDMVLHNDNLLERIIDVC